MKRKPVVYESMIKNLYCFHLGREQGLSIAELQAFFGDKIEWEGETAWLEHEPFEQPRALIDQLGGTTKISERFAEAKKQSELTNALIKKLRSLKPQGKIHFGLNLYPANDRLLNDLLKAIKETMKTEGRNVRFLNQRTNLTTAMVVKGGLMKSRTDLNIIVLKNQWALTQTIAVQNFMAYSLRDYEKPRRLKKEGMLPPKLAQIMINLTAMVSQNTQFEGKILYDPFCGSGTILGEGLIKGMQVIGSDASANAISAAAENLEWIRQNGLCKSEKQPRLFVKEAETVKAKDLSNIPDRVVSELYLGPAKAYRLSTSEIGSIQKKLIPLYQQSLTNLRPLLRAHTPLVLAAPLHHSREGSLHSIPLAKILPEKYKWITSLKYHRKDQGVGRELWILETIE